MSQITVTSHAHRGRTWIAEIVGTDAKYGFQRNFVSKSDQTTARTNVYRDLVFTLDATEGKIYEYRDMNASSSGGASGFWIIENGKRLAIERADVIERLK